MPQGSTGGFTGATAQEQTRARNVLDGLQQADGGCIPLLVFSHLRWDFVTQRPQHLLSQAARSRFVYFWEEPIFHGAQAEDHGLAGTLEYRSVEAAPGVVVLRPHFMEGEDAVAGQKKLLDQFLAKCELTTFDRWYYTPMALAFSGHLRARVTIFDCMDELSAFLGAPAELVEREQELFRVADVVFTGGVSLYEAKRLKHGNVQAFPSSIDVAHFERARQVRQEPQDQAAIARPRVGFHGVLDERLDLELVAGLARLRPEVQFIFVGPVVKIDPATLPQAPNLHYLGSKSYQQLPEYLAGWDATMLPFAINAATRFLSPTKTPEYLAAGKRVVSTPITDVVRGYGDAGLVEIADSAETFALALDRALAAGEDSAWQQAVRERLATSSWERTWDAMAAAIEVAAKRNSAAGKRAPENRKSSLYTFAQERAGPGFARLRLSDRGGRVCRLRHRRAAGFAAG